MEGGLVVGTGDLSELALGWATYNGDQMSMYGVNASVPKTLVRHLVKWAADTEHDPATRATLLRHHRHAGEPQTAPGRRRRQDRPENRGPRGALRTPRLLPLKTSLRAG